jgi:DNA adenine methylase
MNYGYLFPGEFNRYLEPFLGGGAVFFSLRPSRAILSDSNERLTECYRELRDNPGALAKLMEGHQQRHSNDYYYSTRGRTLRTPITRAAQFLYLNRTCWNGLYRVNRNGQFNVPKGTKTTVIFEDKSFSTYAATLKNAKIRCCDYEETIERANVGDFLFVDPPYTAKHNYNGFLKYNETIFSWSDQIRLRAALGIAASKGAKILLCNAHHESVSDLFGDLGSAHILTRKSVIAGEPLYRAEVTEIAIAINYEIDRAFEGQ